jgi:NAD+ synthase
MGKTKQMRNLDVSVLDMDCEAEADRIASSLRDLLRHDLNRRGLVVALSGGIDSSVCAALSVRAVGAKRVYGLLLPERDSSAESLERGRLVAERLGIQFEIQDIEPTLSAIGCYEWRDEAIRRLEPQHTAEWKSKIVIAGGTEGQVNHFRLVLQRPDKRIVEHRLPLTEYLQIVAATNFKQRIRKTLEYFHADRLNYAVVGTPNRLEYDQGFFVKNGDGSADVKPIAHLYKTQVYALARQMDLPEEICSAPPTTDTYSLPQGQDEFYFSLPYSQMDLALWAHNHRVPADALAAALDVPERIAGYIYRDIENKRRTTRYLHNSASLIDQISELER